MRQQWDIEASRRVVVGVNDFTEGSGDIQIETLKIDPAVERRQVASMAEVRASRDARAVSTTLAKLTDACRTSENVMPRILDCARAYCTLYEIRHAMETVFGSYKEPVSF